MEPKPDSHRCRAVRTAFLVQAQRQERGDDRRDPCDRVERAEAQAVDDDDADPRAEALRETLQDTVVADGLRAPRERHGVRDVRAGRGGERAERYAAEHGRKEEEDRHATADGDGGADRNGEDERNARDDHQCGAAEREEPRAITVAPRTDRETGQERARCLDTDDRANDLRT